MYDSASVMAAPTTVARRADQACPGAMRAGGEEISAVYQRVDADAYVVGEWGSYSTSRESSGRALRSTWASRAEQPLRPAE